MTPTNDWNGEQREFERIPQNVKLTLAHLDNTADDGQPDKALTKDISENGVCILSDIRYKVGTLFRVEISLEGWQLFLRTVLKREQDSEIKPLAAIGKVVWSQKLPGSEYIQTGVQFKQFDTEDFTAFKKYLHIIRESIREKGSSSFIQLAPGK